MPHRDSARRPGRQPIEFELVKFFFPLPKDGVRTTNCSMNTGVFLDKQRTCSMTKYLLALSQRLSIAAQDSLVDHLIFVGPAAQDSLVDHIIFVGPAARSVNDGA